MLESCEFGEDSAQKAYEEALDEKELSLETRQVIQNQKGILSSAHHQIKQM